MQRPGAPATVFAEIVGPEFTIGLNRLRRCLLRTEDDDYGLAQCTMLVREVFLDAGRRMVGQNLFDNPDDVFHMIGPELQDALSGSCDKKVSSAIQKRRNDFEQSGLLSPPPMIMNGRAITPKANSSVSTLTGTPASPGATTGIVLVLNNPFSCVGKQFPKNTTRSR